MSYDRQPSHNWLVPMCALLSLLLLCAAEFCGVYALLFFMPLALCMFPLCAENLTGYAIVCDILIAAFVLTLPVPHYAWLAFVCVLAPYVPLRHAFKTLKKAYAAVLVPLGITVLWTALVIVLLSLLNVHVLTVLSPWLTVLCGLGTLLFVFLLDAAYQLLLKAYQNRLRRFLFPRA